MPWGISESAYNVRDRHLTYQYRAFGVPDLALKRGLGRDLVVAPYASALAAMVEPQRALANLRQLERQGALGPYGFRDALDYTRPDARPAATPWSETYMAHHIGMGLVALTNVLAGAALAAPVPRRPAGALRRAAAARAHPAPAGAAGAAGRAGRRGAARSRSSSGPRCASSTRPTRRSRASRCSGDLPYTIMVSQLRRRATAATRTLAVTRWRADGTARRTPGSSAMSRTSPRGRVWSAAHQPVCAPADWYQALARDRSGHLPPGRRRHRDPHRDRGGARGLGRGAAGHGHQQRQRARARSS